MKVVNVLKQVGILAIIGIGITSCDNDNKLEDSIFDIEPKELNELDTWIDNEFRKPFNIRATYKWNQAFGYYDKTLYPPNETNVKPALSMVKKLWIDSYTDVAGEEFIKEIAPRELHLIGSYNRNNDGTIVLGEAGGGARISLFNVDYVKSDNRESITQFVHTVQHEYVHILNQTKPYDKVAWSKISEGGLYTSSWYLSSDAESNELGFVTNYARLNYDEDIAETTSIILLKTKAEWEKFLADIKSESARQDILKKVAIIVDYYKEQFEIDFWELRDRAEFHTSEVVNGNF
ncbi:substrate import-associated zinc metallohydrolase lipoprotein [Myroides sp. C15-4]|uniref:substrate import-associated zinc metallohydrolase lipoprotein n=1 Tax=Myroides sp. C15-4 TaxID=3400532 RepID=UPI003D2F540B